MALRAELPADSMSEARSDVARKAPLAALQAGDDWTMLVGRTVELWREKRPIRTSTVECVSSDSLVLWLRFDGANERQLITKHDGYDIYIID
jgi:hypothetical protein